MNQRRLIHRSFALFLALCLVLPGSAQALRQPNPKDSSPLEQEIRAGLEEPNAPTLPEDSPYRAVLITDVPQFFASLTETEKHEFQNRLLVEKKSGLHYLVKWRVFSNQLLWPDANSPAREYLSFKLARILGVDVADVVIPELKDRRQLAKFYNLQNPDNLYLVRLTEDYSADNPEDRAAMPQLLPDLAVTDQLGVAVLFRTYDFRKENLGPVQGSRVRVMFDEEQSFHPSCTIEALRRSGRDLRLP